MSCRAHVWSPSNPEARRPCLDLSNTSMGSKAHLSCQLRLSSCVLLLTCALPSAACPLSAVQHRHVYEQVHRPCGDVQATQPGAPAAVWSSRLASPHQASGSGSGEVRKSSAFPGRLCRPACQTLQTPLRTTPELPCTHVCCQTCMPGKIACNLQRGVLTQIRIVLSLKCLHLVEAQIEVGYQRSTAHWPMSYAHVVLLA